jgi:3-deoxy-D-manno-octulosonic-acid transferase
LILARDRSNAERFLRLGATTEQIRITGSTKFDEDPPQQSDVERFQTAISLSRGENSPDIIVFGSFHRNEFTIALKGAEDIWRELPRTIVIIAPRYPETASSLYQSISRRKIPVSLRSAGGKILEGGILILDTIGELLFAYSVGSVAVIGGSFSRRGGQNPIEPAICGKPIIFGPHMENFSEETAILKNFGAIQINLENELGSTLVRLLKERERLEHLGRQMKEALMPHKGASERVYQIIEEVFLKTDRRSS